MIKAVASSGTGLSALSLVGGKWSKAGMKLGSSPGTRSGERPTLRIHFVAALTYS